MISACVVRDYGNIVMQKNTEIHIQTGKHKTHWNGAGISNVE